MSGAVLERSGGPYDSSKPLGTQISFSKQIFSGPYDSQNHVGAHTYPFKEIILLDNMLLILLFNAPVMA